MMRTGAIIFASLVAASPAFAAGDGGDGLLYPIINFVLLIAGLVYFARKPVLQFLSDRRGDIQNDLKKSADLLGEAEAKFATWQGKLAALDQELESIRATSRERAENERTNIIADANATAERIMVDARAAIDQEVRRSRVILREEAADLAVELAEKLLRENVTDGDRERLVTEFIDRVASNPRAAGTGN